MIRYDSVEELVKLAEKENRAIAEIVMEDQAIELSNNKAKVYEIMKKSLNVMEESIKEGMNKDLRSTSGLSGGSAYKMQSATDSGKNISGKVIGGAIAKALAVAETNSSMGRIVAAPTAGSCGILPAALISIRENYEISEEDIVKSMFTASAIGMIIAKNASIAGAEGGCQAECGAASAMAAAALTEIMGGTPNMVSSSVAIALKNILGLVCDPVAGLVEIPCIKRNASGVANAFVAADMALAGIESMIPVDEVIYTMKKIGESMPNSLKETSEGGLAATPTGKRLKEKVFG